MIPSFIAKVWFKYQFRDRSREGGIESCHHKYNDALCILCQTFSGSKPTGNKLALKIGRNEILRTVNSLTTWRELIVGLHLNHSSGENHNSRNIDMLNGNHFFPQSSLVRGLSREFLSLYRTDTHAKILKPWRNARSWWNQENQLQI